LHQKFVATTDLNHTPNPKPCPNTSSHHMGKMEAGLHGLYI